MIRKLLLACGIIMIVAMIGYIVFLFNGGTLPAKVFRNPDYYSSGFIAYLCLAGALIVQFSLPNDDDD